MELLPDELSSEKLWKVIKFLLPDHKAPLPDAPDDPLWWRLYYAARWMHNHDQPQDEDLRDIWHGRVTTMLAHVLDLGALPPIERVELGKILGQWGDPRPGVGLDDNGLPDIYRTWCDVPAGEFQYGHEKESDNPPQRVTLEEPFKIAKYPVTVAQFNAFLAENPAENDPLWDGMPGEEKDFMGEVYPVREFRETRDDYANHPRTYVSWYQAIAFCRWLTKKYHDNGRLDKSLVIWLPHEQWWEKAARGADDGREYPYEGEFDASKGNTDETNIGGTSAVGAFPAGASPYGLMDASGNVWEWCASKNGEPDMLLPDDSGASRVLRGGSFDSFHNGARVSYRYYGDPANRNHYRGFRVCCVRPLS